MIVIMLYFQFYHKPKHLREILSQPVKSKHSWALLSPMETFHSETNNSCYVQKNRLSWVTERILLSHHKPRDKSRCQDFLKCACDGQCHGYLFSSPCGMLPSLISRFSMMSCRTHRHRLLQSPTYPQSQPSLVHSSFPIVIPQAFCQKQLFIKPWTKKVLGNCE